MKYYTELTVKELTLADAGKYLLEANVENFVSLVTIELEVQGLFQIVCQNNVMSNLNSLPLKSPTPP